MPKTMWYIVMRNGQYLMNTPISALTIEQWSDSAYEAMKFAGKNAAKRIARMVGGKVARLDPVRGVVWIG